MSDRAIFVAMPCGGHTAHRQAFLKQLACPDHVVDDVSWGWTDSGFPLFNFNTVWERAVNGYDEGRYGKFVMLHSDVCPDEPTFVKVLSDIADRNHADIVSAIVPHKNPFGTTSTCFETDDPWTPQNLSLEEAFQFPETFSHPKLLVNNGCMLVRLGDWCRRVCFQQPAQWVVRNGGRKIETMSEDYDFCRQARAQGATRIYATRAVRLWHGDPWWHNRHPWDYKRDRDEKVVFSVNGTAQAELVEP